MLSNKYLNIVKRQLYQFYMIAAALERAFKSLRNQFWPCHLALLAVIQTRKGEGWQMCLYSCQGFIVLFHYWNWTTWDTNSAGSSFYYFFYIHNCSLFNLFLPSPQNTVNMTLTCKTVWDVENFFLPWSQKDTNHSLLIANFSYPVGENVKWTEHIILLVHHSFVWNERHYS